MRPTNRPLLACSLPSFGDRVAMYPPLLNPEEDGPSLLLFVTLPPAESMGNQVGRLTFIFLSSWGLEAHTTLRNGCRCHRHCQFLVCGRVPWHLRNPDQSTCVSRLYMPELRRYPVHPPALPYPDRGVVWRSVQSVFTRLFTQIIACFSALQDMCICMLSVISPSLRDGLFFTTNRDTEAP